MCCLCVQPRVVHDLCSCFLYMCAYVCVTESVIYARMDSYLYVCEFVYVYVSQTSYMESAYAMYSLKHMYMTSKQTHNPIDVYAHA